MVVNQEDSSEDEDWTQSKSNNNESSVSLGECDTDTSQQFDEAEEDIEDAEDKVEDEDEFSLITEGVKNMKMTNPSFKRFLLSTEYPFLLYDFSVDLQKKVAIDLLVPVMEDDDFHVTMNADGTELLLSTSLPDFSLMLCVSRWQTGPFTTTVAKQLHFRNLW